MWEKETRSEKNAPSGKVRITGDLVGNCFSLQQVQPQIYFVVLTVTAIQQQLLRLCLRVAASKCKIVNIACLSHLSQHAI